MIIFMNENLKKPQSRKPKITIQFSDGRQIHLHELTLTGKWRIRTGRCKEVKTNVVHAWLELVK